MHSWFNYARGDCFATHRRDSIFRRITIKFMNILKIQIRDPQHLKSIHKSLRLVPELPEGSEEFLALAAGLKKAGFIRPILIDQEDHIIDDHSRNLVRAARRWQMKEVPVQVCSSADAPMLLIHSLAHVRHLSKSAIAYLAVPHLQPALDAARMAKLEKLRKGQEIPVVSAEDDGDKTVEDLAEELGIGRNLIFLAREVRRSFEDKTPYTFNIVGGPKDGSSATMTLKEWFEPRLLQPFVGGEHEQNRPMGLGGIKAGITAVIEGDPSKFNPKGKPQQMDFFTEMFTRDARKFIKLPEAKRQKAFDAVEQLAAETPPEECEQLAATYKQMAKIYTDAAKSTHRSGN